MSKEFSRKTKEDKPVIAICYVLTRHYPLTICRLKAIYNQLDMT